MLHTHAFDSETLHKFTVSSTVSAVNGNKMLSSPITDNNAWKSGDYYILRMQKAMGCFQNITQ